MSTDYGFTWGPATVERCATFPARAAGKKTHVLRVNDLTIYVSPTGRTRVFRKGKGELKA